MTTSSLPKNPVENWEQVRDDWVAEVDRVIRDAEEWSAGQGWGTRRETKRIEESRLGPYEAPRLLIHSPTGRVLLEPYARFVGGAEGAFDLFAIPSWGGMIVAKLSDGWQILIEGDTEGPRVAWSEAHFVDVARRLAEIG